MGVPLFSIVAAIILISAGGSLIIFLIKSLFQAIGVTIPKMALPNIKERRLESILQKRINAIEELRSSKDFLILPADKIFKPFDFIEIQTHLEAIPLLLRVHLLYFETALAYIEGGHIHCERLGVLEALFNEKQSLLEAIIEILRTEKKLRNAKNRDPNNWAMKEIERQKKELEESLLSNTKELKDELQLFVRTIEEVIRKSHSEKAIH